MDEQEMLASEILQSRMMACIQSFVCFIIVVYD